MSFCYIWLLLYIWEIFYVNYFLLYMCFLYKIVTEKSIFFIVFNNLQPTLWSLCWASLLHLHCAPLLRVTLAFTLCVSVARHSCIYTVRLCCAALLHLPCASLLRLPTVPMLRAFTLCVIVARLISSEGAANEPRIRGSLVFANQLKTCRWNSFARIFF